MARSDPTSSLPPSILTSALMRSGGYCVFEGIIDDSIRRRLLAEALQVSSQGTRCIVESSDDEQVRGGRPARSLVSASGGDVQEAFYAASWLLDHLRALTHPSLVPAGRRGTYSYYVRAGDHLAVHRDIVGCEVAVISCLSDASRQPDDSGALCLYPERLFEPLSSVRANAGLGAIKVRLYPGQTLVMYGGVIPHSLLPIGHGQSRIVSILCFTLP